MLDDAYKLVGRNFEPIEHYFVLSKLINKVQSQFESRYLRIKSSFEENIKVYGQGFRFLNSFGFLIG